MRKLIKRIWDFIAGLDFDGSSNRFKYAILPSIEITGIEVINLQKDDVVVLHTKRELSYKEIERIGIEWKKICPNNKLFVLENGNMLNMIRKDNEKKSSD